MASEVQLATRGDLDGLLGLFLLGQGSCHKMLTV